MYDEHLKKAQVEAKDPYVDQTMYQRIVGKQLYLNMPRPENLVHKLLVNSYRSQRSHILMLH